MTTVWHRFEMESEKGGIRKAAKNLGWRQGVKEWGTGKRKFDGNGEFGERGDLTTVCQKDLD